MCASRDVDSLSTDYGRFIRYECRNCGHYVISGLAKAEIGEDGWKLAAYVWSHHAIDIEPFFVSSQATLADDPPHQVRISDAIADFPRSTAARLDGALCNLAARTHLLGEQIIIPRSCHCPMLLAQQGEIDYIVQHLKSEDYLRDAEWIEDEVRVVVTVKALNRASDLRRGLLGATSKQVFVAMSFDSSLNEAWEDGLKPGIEEAGFSALRVDAKEHNEKICDVIVAVIRQSRFLVADFTLHRGGVYFEAGLMMGLGRPVIFTCRKDELAKAHFDTRQYNHIEWEKPAELKERLKRRIQATITP